MKKRYLHIFAAMVFSIPYVIFAKTSDETLEKIKIKQSLYFNQKKYEAVIVIGPKLVQVSDYRDKKAEELLINSYHKQIEALITARQAKILMDNQQILQAEKTVKQALDISPESGIIINLRDRIGKMLIGLNPLAHLSEAEKIEFQKLLKSGQSSLDNGKDEEALGFFAKTILMAPKSPEAIEGYNLALVRTNKENTSGRVRELLVKADQLIQEKKYPEAVQTLDEVLTFDPINSYAINKKTELSRLIKDMSQRAQKEELAKQYLDDAKKLEEQNNYDSAIEKYNLGFSLLSDYTAWKKLILEAERRKKEFEERKFSKSLDDIAKSYQKGIYYLASEEFSRAVTEFESVINIAKQYGQDETIKQATEFLQKAQDNFKRKEEENVGTTNPYYKMVNNIKILGISAYNEQRYDLSKQYFNSILELFPKNKFARIYYLKSDIELNPGSKEDVIGQFIADIDRAIEAKDINEAKRLLAISIEIDPDNPELKKINTRLNKTRQQTLVKQRTVPLQVLDTWYRQAFAALTQENDSKKASGLLTKIIAEDPTYIKAVTLKARIEGRSQVTQEARAVPVEAQKFYSEGLWHYGQGRIREAKDSFDQALRIDPTYQNAITAREKCVKYLQQTGI